MRHVHQAEQWLPYSIERVFDFFADPENLPRLMPGWQMARIEEAVFAPPPPRPDPAVVRTRLPGVAAGQGTRMTISFRPFPFSPIRVPWDAEITEFVWDEHFATFNTVAPSHTGVTAIGLKASSEMGEKERCCAIMSSMNCHSAYSAILRMPCSSRFKCDTSSTTGSSEP